MAGLAATVKYPHALLFLAMTLVSVIIKMARVLHQICANAPWVIPIMTAPLQFATTRRVHWHVMAMVFAHVTILVYATAVTHLCNVKRLLAIKFHQTIPLFAVAEEVAQDQICVVAMRAFPDSIAKSRLALAIWKRNPVFAVAEASVLVPTIARAARNTLAQRVKHCKSAQKPIAMVWQLVTLVYALAMVLALPMEIASANPDLVACNAMHKPASTFLQRTRFVFALAEAFVNPLINANAIKAMVDQNANNLHALPMKIVPIIACVVVV